MNFINQNAKSWSQPEKDFTMSKKPNDDSSHIIESEKWNKYRNSKLGSDEEYYFYKLNRELIEEAKKKSK